MSRPSGSVVDVREREAVLILEQTLNGVQLGVMLFLMASGLTLVFGIMNFINLAHGSLSTWPGPSLRPGCRA